MIETYIERIHTENLVLDIGLDIGALIVYTRPELRSREIEVSPPGNAMRRTHTNVHERLVNERTIFAAVFQELREGEYTLWRNGQAERTITIRGGEIAEVDWSNLVEAYIPTFARHDSCSAPRTSSTPSAPRSNLLPPRYQDGRTISAAPMGAAALIYDEDGRVAWNEIWTDFCDLALAGGPPHRGTLLEPVMPEEIQADLPGYERNLSEIERGLHLVTGLQTLKSEKPGWLGLICTSEEMALWLLRAIIVENICVRREGTILFLPVGPAFTLEKEIKNVITVVAKTHHYWTEHSRSLV